MNLSSYFFRVINRVHQFMQCLLSLMWRYNHFVYHMTVQMLSEMSHRGLYTLHPMCIED